MLKEVKNGAKTGTIASVFAPPRCHSPKMSMAIGSRQRYIKSSMKNGAITLICAGSCVALALAAHAAAKSPTEDHAVNSDNPYGAITERNIFDLHDPPPPQVEKKEDKGPPPNIKLTGITTIFGKSQALFILNTLGAAGKPPTTRSLILNEGQRQGEVEVLEINPKGRSAKVKIDEVEATLTIETNKGTINMQANAGGPGSQGAPGMRTSPYAAPPGTPPGFPHNPYSDKAIPPRQPRTDVQQPNGSANPYGAGNPYNGGAPNVQTPQGALNLAGPAAGGLSQTAAQPTMSPQESWTLMEYQKAASQAGQADPGIASIMPATPLSAPNQQESSQNEGANISPGGAPNSSPGPQLPGALQPKTTGNIYVPH
jgi:hypothetical protein